MISVDLAVRLKAAGLAWTPASGDRFHLPDRDLDDTVFVVSEMTIETVELPTGGLVRFNGTTEWALDSVAIEDALWHPLEGQLRDLLGGTFRRLERTTGGYVVRTEVLDDVGTFAAADASDASARAVLALVAASAEGTP